MKLGGWKGKLKACRLWSCLFLWVAFSYLLPLSQLSFLIYKIKGWTEPGWRSRLLGILADGLFLRFPFILTSVL